MQDRELRRIAKEMCRNLLLPESTSENYIFHQLKIVYLEGVLAGGRETSQIVADTLPKPSPKKAPAKKAA